MNQKSFHLRTVSIPAEALVSFFVKGSEGYPSLIASSRQESRFSFEEIETFAALSKSDAMVCEDVGGNLESVSATQFCSPGR